MATLAGMRTLWIAVLALGCGGESGKVLGSEGSAGTAGSAGVAGNVSATTGGSGGSAGSAGTGHPVGSAGLSGSAGSGLGVGGDGGTPELGAGGAGEASGGVPSVGAGGAPDADSGGGGEAGEVGLPGPELLWSYVVTATAQNPSLEGRNGTHRMSVLLDGDRARPCVNLSWTVDAGETGSRIATQQELLALQDCLTFSNADTWVIQVRDPAFELNEEHTLEPPPERSAWVLTEARVNIVENTWEWEGTSLRDEWELWGYPR